jgi:hypothetical protein
VTYFRVNDNAFIHVVVLHRYSTLLRVSSSATTDFCGHADWLLLHAAQDHSLSV